MKTTLVLIFNYHIFLLISLNVLGSRRKRAEVCSSFICADILSQFRIEFPPGAGLFILLLERK